MRTLRVLIDWENVYFFTHSCSLFAPSHSLSVTELVRTEYLISTLAELLAGGIADAICTLFGS